MMRVYWKDEEKKKIARSAAASFHTGVTQTKLHAFRIGMETSMPPNRHRQINVMNDVPWFEEQFTIELNNLRWAQQVFVEKPKVISTSISVPAPAHIPAPAPVEAKEMVSDALRPILVDWLAGIFKEALVSAVREIAGAEHKFATISMTPSKLETVLNGVLKKPSVLVAGLRGAQKQVIIAEFGHVIDLRFYESDKSKDQLRAMAEQADVSIAFTDFLSHSHCDIMEARSKQYIAAGGGMTQLKDTITNVIAKLH